MKPREAGAVAFDIARHRQSRWDVNTTGLSGFQVELSVGTSVRGDAALAPCEACVVLSVAAVGMLVRDDAALGSGSERLITCVGDERWAITRATITNGCPF